ncbi:CHRD domain-containing protein [Sediminibacter sp. Hel_I_10]|uniref:CHRD domain-containing protein n=1 Tax=Sediminibacter sp. Hel_I_10 TaxID=1392490 RepID=UPI00047DDEC7|nr:CHRD domain-containing protein [Sediminibacter sp. Hel_I_10]
MKKLFTYLMVIPLAFLTNCSDDDDNTIVIGPTGETKTYQLGSVADPSISGTATFIENSDASTTIELQLTGTPDGGMHPAHIHFGDAIDAGEIALTLGTVDGTTGSSSITKSTLDDGTSISYDELINFDGYINVHLSSDDLGTLVAQGLIGENELINSMSYPLNTVDIDGISGMVTFSERVNGEILSVIDLDGTTEGGLHPAHIHSGSAENPDMSPNIIVDLSPVVGETGLSYTNITMLNDNTPLSYSDILTIDGYVNVHLSADDLATLAAQGNVGANAN